MAVHASSAWTAVFLAALAMAGACLCMASFSWLVIETNSTTLNVGLKKYRLTNANGVTTEGQITSETSPVPNRLKVDEGGNNVLAAGITGLFLIFLGAIFVMVWVLGQRFQNLTWMSAMSFMIGGFLLILAGALYANKLSLGWSYVVFTFVGPFAMTSGVTMLYHMAQNSKTAVAP
eukprot:c33026_g1_i1.p2 GENE.c33026_g1_i1~~c33026_g1_i1.p2  ORF type:complete len:176 (+),score=32.82 c33026_g1_i1:36-563(+)